MIKGESIMANDEYLKKLERVIKQMLLPLKGIPFNIIIQSISGHEVIEFDRDDKEHYKLLKNLTEVAKMTCVSVNKKGIKRPRPNEVGNDIEPFVIDSLNACGISAKKPCTKSGKKQSVGYPDIEITCSDNRKHYIECKTFSEKTKGTSQRSFYLSPSEDFKVNHDAIHFIMGFEIYVDKKVGNNNIYKTKAWKILDAYQLECDLKHEFNSDNARLYQDSMILAEGPA
jgi:hypothetical protein